MRIFINQNFITSAFQPGYNLFRKTALVLLAIACGFFVNAQNITVRGVIKNESGQPVAKAFVILREKHLKK